MPRLTQALGPWLAPHDGRIVQRLSREKRLLSALLAELPKVDVFRQTFDYSITNWLPFYWQGYTGTTRYTYLLRDLTDLDKVLAGFESAKRATIRKASAVVGIEEDLAPGEFYAYLSKAIRCRGGTMTYGEEFFRRIYDAAHRSAAGKSLYAVDSVGNVHAAVLIVWNARSAYLLVTMNAEEHKNSGALSLLVWNAIRFASDKARAFDFEGSMNEGVEAAYRSFGAEQVPYFAVSKITSIGTRVREDVRSWLSLLAEKGRR